MAPSIQENPEKASTEVTFSAQDIARMVDGRLEGDPEARISGIAPVDQARSGELAFLAQPRYLKFVPECQAQAVLVSEALAPEVTRFPTRIVVPAAHGALPALLAAYFPPRERTPDIHPTAVFGKGVELGKGVSIGPYTVVGAGSKIEEGVRIGPQVSIGEGCRIGKDSELFPQVVLYPGTKVGERVILHAGVRLGSDGFGYVTVDGKHTKVPQVGACIVEDDVEIGANTCIDRGSIGKTVVGRGSKLDNLVQLAHNVQVGEGALITAQVGVAGSSRLGSHTLFGGQAGIAGHTEIGDGAMVGAQSGVIGDLEPGEVVSGYPARDHKDYLRAMAMVFKLPKTLRRMKELEERLRALEEEAED